MNPEEPSGFGTSSYYRAMWVLARGRCETLEAELEIARRGVRKWERTVDSLCVLAFFLTFFGLFLFRAWVNA